MMPDAVGIVKGLRDRALHRVDANRKTVLAARLRSGRKAGCCEQWAGEARRQVPGASDAAPLAWEGRWQRAEARSAGKGGLQRAKVVEGRTGLPPRSATRVENDPG